MRFLLFFLCFISVYAKSHIMSPIPLPKQEVLDIDSQACNQKCLKELYQSNYLFSFVAKFSPTIRDEYLQAKFAEILEDLDLMMKTNFFDSIQDSKKIKIALLVPKDIVGRYSTTGINTILAYLTSREVSFLFEVFDSKNEEALNLHQTYEEIRQKKFDCIVALLTQDGVGNLLENTKIALPTYIPTVNKKQFANMDLPNTLLFGGIDYEQQVQMLSVLANGEEIVEYDDASSIGNWLQRLSEEMDFNIVFQDMITTQKAAKFSQEILKQEDYLANRAVLLNIPVIKTGLILPQISFLKTKPTKFLSTQINYNPSLLMLLKPKDRQNFFIINAIGKTDANLLEYGLLLGSDLKYDWVSYSIGIGIEAFFLNRGEKIQKFFSETIEDAQVNYTNKIFKTHKNTFIQIHKENN